MRGAHDLVEARRARAVRSGHTRGQSRDSARNARPVRGAPRPAARDAFQGRGEGGHPRAEGGRREPAGAARRADRAPSGGRSCGRCCAPCRATRHCAAHYPHRGAPLRHVHAVARRAAAGSRACAHVLLRADGLRARPHRQRAAVHRRDVAAIVAARCAATTRSSSTTSPTSTTRSTTPRRAQALSSPRGRPSGTSRTRATSGSAARPPAEGDRVGAADRRVHRGADRRAGTRTRAVATCTSASRASPSTAGCLVRSPTRSSRERSRAR